MAQRPRSGNCVWQINQTGGAFAVPLLPQGSVQKVGDESHDGLLHQRITIMGREWNVHNIITGVTKEMKAALPRNLKKHYQNKQSH